ncbi:MAG: NAD(+) synthase, partial [Candidatus Cryptobacteroides sp.]
SAKTISGYVYCSAGYGESTQDLVYSGAALIAEYGHILAENERFNYGESMVVADIDAAKLDNLRQKSTSFKAYCPDGRCNWKGLYRRIDAGAAADTDFEKELLHKVEPHPFIPSGDSGELDRRCREILSIQVEGLATRLAHIHCKSVVIGVSGGLDSTLVLIVATMAFDKLGLDRKGITGVTMPGYGTTGRTRGNAVDLMEALGISSREISITAACAQHFQDIGHDGSVHDVTYENSQARERTQILMDIANQTSGIVVGTGDLSELALGWATYNGDHMSMYGVNVSIPKTLVRYLVKWAAENKFEGQSGGRSVREILLDVVDTPVSPELLPADEDGNILQVTENLVGPYELHDFFLYNLQRFGFPPEKIYFLACKAFDGVYDCKTVEKWLRTFLRRFFSQQFKRSCLPDGPKVGSISLSPRGDWRMPSDSSPAEFLGSLD